MVTTLPALVVVGVKLVIVGGKRNTKPVSVAMPPGVVTATSPVAPLSTVAVILVESVTVNEAAAVPPKLTAETSLKLWPVMVICTAGAPYFGVNDVIAGTP